MLRNDGIKQSVEPGKESSRTNPKVGFDETYVASLQLSRPPTPLTKLLWMFVVHLTLKCDFEAISKISNGTGV